MTASDVLISKPFSMEIVTFGCQCIPGILQHLHTKSYKLLAFQVISGRVGKNKCLHSLSCTVSVALLAVYRLRMAAVTSSPR